MRSLLTKLFLTVLCGGISAADTTAGQYNPALSPGDEAPAWSGLPGIDGKAHDLAEWKDRVLVVVFTGNTCPYAIDAEDRLVELSKKYAEQPVTVIAINSNTGADDDLDAMQKRANEKGFSFPYLKDSTGLVGKEFGALRTPEFFVLNKARKVVYLGQFADNTADAGEKTGYVEAAVEAALNNTMPPATETPPIGCSIKYPRVRP